MAIERRGRRSTGTANETTEKEVEEDLIAEVQRLRAENDIPKKLASLGFGKRATPEQKTQVVQKLRQEFSLAILLGCRSTASCNLLLSSKATEESR